MQIVALYSFNRGREVMETEHPAELAQIYEVIRSINAEEMRTKKSKEKTRKYGMLYAPKAMNEAIKDGFHRRNWQTVRVSCQYPTEYYVDGYRPDKGRRGQFREMDFVKNKVGIEVQFGKYSFMVYNVAAKMTIFHNLKHIDVGVEIVPVKDLSARMSTGVSYFEQFVWDLTHRGIADIDIPVLIVGIIGAINQPDQMSIDTTTNF